MRPQIYFWSVIVLLTLLVILCDRKYAMLRDISKAKPKPFSWSRVQLAWWTVIVLSSFIATLIAHQQAPNLNQSTLVLLGISAATIAAGSIIDNSEINNPAIPLRGQDEPGVNFFLDILSDVTGVSIYRFQTVIFNFVFGVWFINYVLSHISASPVNDIMPEIGNNNLILLGLSSATYAALKTTENKSNSKVLSTTPADEGAVG
jgi:hypothetical protein